MLGDFESTYNILLDEVNSVSLNNRRIHNSPMLILLYKSMFLTKYPIYMKNMFTLRISSSSLCGNYILTLPVPKTTTYATAMRTSNETNPISKWQQILQVKRAFL